MNTNLKITLATTVAALLLSGCGDDTTTQTADSSLLTLSGRLIDGTSRVGVSNMEVTIKANGNILKSTTNSNGDFKFDNISKDSSYIINVKDTNSKDNINYASYSFTGVTSNNGLITTQELGAFKIYEEANATIEIRDVQTNKKLSGFYIYTDPLNGTLNGIGEIVATDLNGSYIFTLPKDNKVLNVSINNLELNGTKYIFADKNLLTTNIAPNLKAGDTQVVYLEKDIERIYKLQMHIVDENGTDTTLPYAVLPITNNANGDTLFAKKVDNSESDYIIELKESDIVNDQFSFTLGNFDSDNDGFLDTAAKHIALNQTAFTLDKDSFNQTSYTATIPVTIESIKHTQNINVVTLSDISKVYANTENKLIVGFDRPVKVVSDAQAIYQILTKKSTPIDAIKVADIYDKNDGSGTDIADADLQLAGDNIGKYRYDNDENDDGFTDKVTDDNLKIENNPYQNEFSREIKVNNNLAVNLKANNTIMEITLPADILKDHLEINVNVQLEGELNDSPRFVYSKDITPISATTLTTLNDLTIDDEDYSDTQKFDVITGTQTPLSYATNHSSQFITITDSNASDQEAYIEYLKYSAVGTATTLNRVDTTSDFYLVSPTKLTGSAKIVSYIEEYNDNNTVASKTIDATENILGFNLSSTATTTDENSNNLKVTNVTQTVAKLEKTPANHYYSGTDANNITNFTSAYNSLVTLKSGFDIEDDTKLYYIYSIKLNNYTPTSANSKIKQITLDFDISTNNTKLTGEKTFLIK